MKEQIQSSENFEIPSRRRRFSAYIIDVIINVIVVRVCLLTWPLCFRLIPLWIIINLVIVFWWKTTLWSSIMRIKVIKNNNSSINIKQVFFRYWVFSPILLNVTICIRIFVSIIFRLISVQCPPKCSPNFSQMKYTISIILDIFCIIASIPCLINIVEIFFECPTFIDKRLWIKRFYKKSK